MSGVCHDCIDYNCLCREGHAKRELENAFTEKMCELLPNSVEELKENLRRTRSVQQLTLYEKPIEDIKPNRWITIGEQLSFCEFLSNLGINVDKLDWCASEWKRYQCSVNHSHATKTTYVACGKRGVCPRCSMSYASKRAGIMYQWVKQNIADRIDFDLKLNQIVLTLPENLHRNIESKLFAKMIKKFMKHFQIDSFGYCIQTRHSKDPLAEKYVHCHILSLNMKSEENKVIESSYFFDVDEMRKVWKDVIEDFTNEVIEGDVNLHTEYASVLHDRNKVVHMFSYLYRYPVQDLFRVQIRDQSINYVQSPQFEKNQNQTLEGTSVNQFKLQQIQQKVMDLFDEKKPRIVWCGLLSSTKRNELIDMILHVGMNETLDDTPNTLLQLNDNSRPSFRWKNLPEIQKEMELRAKECLDCGSPYENEPFEWGFYEGDNEPIIRR